MPGPSTTSRAWPWHTTTWPGKLRDRGHENFSLDIFGKLGDVSLLGLIGGLGLSEHVRLLGPLGQAELQHKYRRGEYDVFAFPTWDREPFGFAPLEAAAYGCVPITSEVRGLAEWFVHDVHCLKSSEPAPPLSDKLVEILEGRIDLRALGSRASSVIWREFSLSAIMPRIEQILNTAATHRHLPQVTPQEAYHLSLIAEKLTGAGLLKAA